MIKVKGERVVSGMRPTGAFHLGHYVGAVRNWVELQKTYDTFIFIADWHALTSQYENVDIIKNSRYDYVRSWLACGLDPNKSVIYNQSDIPEVLNLLQVFLCLTPPGWADRSPSWKDYQQDIETKSKVLDNLGFYTYPVLQAADIALMQGKWVPVGLDQVPHIEIARDIVKKFNRFYKAALPEPEAKLTETPKLLGLGGEKMSSSLGNVITLTETEKSLQQKINKLVTDTNRKGVEFAGNPDNCSVFTYHKTFSPVGEVAVVNTACRSASLSCGECKQKLGSYMKEIILPIGERYQAITEKDCQDILAEGNALAQKEATQVWQDVRQKLKF
ncbi:MAG: tryptophan--tRNA ligase [Bacteriovoracaceae bacterium]|nr:tryptophan--tRNA ligase [Bacteriovoracaceae bacterium]